MGFEVDNVGRIMSENGRSAIPDDNQDKWRAAIQLAIDEAAENGGAPPENVRYFVVEEGDCLWTIAERNDVSPMELIDYNRQFAVNPDLIHPGEVVFAAPPSPTIVGPQGNDKVGVFAQSIEDRALVAHNNDDGAQAIQQWEDIKTDINLYLATLPPDQYNEALLRLIGYDWVQESSHARQVVIEAYLESVALNNPTEYAQYVNSLKNPFSSDEHGTDEAVLRDINDAAIHVANRHDNITYDG